jgi:2-polyprenyl-3-methyl-5-hydroxy-6-metoxy-1,4-benzoquinol methylase
MPLTSNRSGAARVAEAVLADARRFAVQHASSPGIGTTYRYFTDHPVAPLNRRRLEALLEAIQTVSEEKARPLRVFDVACGGGLIACAIAARGHSTLGVDLSESEIAFAQEFATNTGSRARFLTLDVIEDPRWEERAAAALGGAPDVVTLAYALHHLPRVGEFVARLSTWLNPSAVLVVNEENPWSPLFQLKHRVRGLIQKDTDVEWHRSYRSWAQLLAKSGFVVSAPRGFDVVPVLPAILPAVSWSLVFRADLMRRPVTHAPGA